MKRRDFLKRIGITSAAILAAPLVLGKEPREKLYSTDIKRADYTPEMWRTAEESPVIRSHRYTPLDILETWKKTGILYCQPYTETFYL